jgi:hypothetical protein
MKGEALGVVGLSPEPGAVNTFGRACKMSASNNFRKSPHRFIRFHLAILKHEQPVVGQFELDASTYRDILI